MNTTIEYTEILKRRIREESDGFFARNVVKDKWPTGVGMVTSTITLTPAADRSQSVGRVREFHLQQSALHSPTIYHNAKDQSLSAEDCFVINAVDLWERRFRDCVAAEIKDRVVVGYHEPRFQLFRKDPPEERVNLDFAPRRSLFGRVVRAFKEKDSRLVVNKKHRRCPHQVMLFHPDIVHFLFPEHNPFPGDITWRSESSDDSVGYYRLVAASAAKPVRTDLGRIITVLPPGLRGLLYRVVWGLLKIKP